MNDFVGSEDITFGRAWVCAVLRSKCVTRPATPSLRSKSVTAALVPSAPGAASPYPTPARVTAIHRSRVMEAHDICGPAELEA